MHGRTLLLSACLLVATSSSALAQCCEPAPPNWLDRACHKFLAGWELNKQWPLPYVYSDRAKVMAPFEAMTTSGWQLQNTLSDYHFDSNTGLLNEAGRLKVKSIVIYAPPQYQQVYVLRADVPELTMARLESTRAAALQLAPPGTDPQIVETYVPPRGWSAHYADSINRAYQESAPAPRIPELKREED